MNTGEVADTGKLLVTLYWMSLKPTNEDYSMRLKLLNGVRHVWGQQEGPAALGCEGLPASGRRGQVVEDIREIPVFAGTPPGSCTIELLVTGLREGKALEPADGGELLLGPSRTATRSRASGPKNWTTDQLLNARLGDQSHPAGIQGGKRLPPGRWAASDAVLAGGA